MKFKRKEHIYFDVREQKVRFDKYSWLETIKWYMVNFLVFKKMHFSKIIKQMFINRERFK